MRLLMLKQRSDFLRARDGERYHGKGFILQAVRQRAHDREDARCRFGITVSHKAVRGALVGREGRKGQGQGNHPTAKKRGALSVKRNRMRRRLRAALTDILPRLNLFGVDFVVIGRPGLATIKFEILTKDLEKGFQKLHRKLIPTHNKRV